MSTAEITGSLMPPTPARKPALNQMPSVREVTPVYWRQLIEVGVPIDVAQIIAWAIARYDIGRRLPEPQQLALIQHYCRYLCRANLWRSRLLLASINL